MAILTIISIVISLIQMILKWFASDIVAKGRVPTEAQSKRLSELLNLTAKLNANCATYGITAASDDQVLLAALEE